VALHGGAGVALDREAAVGERQVGSVIDRPVRGHRGSSQGGVPGSDTAGGGSGSARPVFFVGLRGAVVNRNGARRSGVHIVFAAPAPSPGSRPGLLTRSPVNAAADQNLEPRSRGLKVTGPALRPGPSTVVAVANPPLPGYTPQSDFANPPGTGTCHARADAAVRPSRLRQWGAPCRGRGRGRGSRPARRLVRAPRRLSP